MKKTLMYIVIFFAIILSILISKYYELKEIDAEVKKFNLNYEKYLNREILGTDLASVINKAMDDNEQAYVKKDENGKYIQNDENSVNIEIKINDLEKDKIYPMESLYNGGISEFVSFYREVKFKCTKAEYNSKKHIKYMLFEQVG